MNNKKNISHNYIDDMIGARESVYNRARACEGKSQPLTIVVDTREQSPLPFASIAGVSTTVRKLDTGDYSLDGHIMEVCIERKSPDDLVGTMINGYRSMKSKDWIEGRFNRELMRMQRYDQRWLIVECPRAMIEAHGYRSAADPQSVLGFVRELQVCWKVQVYWAKDRTDAAEEVARICRAYLSKIRERKRRDKQEG